MAITIARNGNLQHTALIFCITAVFLNKKSIDQDQRVLLQTGFREINKTLKVSLWFPPSVDWKVSRDLAVSDRPISDRGAGVHDWSVPDWSACSREGGRSPTASAASMPSSCRDWPGHVTVNSQRTSRHSQCIIGINQKWLVIQFYDGLCLKVSLDIKFTQTRQESHIMS